MKLGILGTGKIVRELMKEYACLPVEKTYILATPRSLERAESFGLDGVFTDYDKLLASDIDTVYVALPNDLHYAYTKKALEKGKDVILEKPATSNLRELEELYALAEEKGRILVEAVTTHQIPGFAALKAAMQTLGPVESAHFRFCQHSSRYNDFLAGIIHPVFDPAKSGGALYDLNVYNVHAALSLFGVPENVDYEATVCKGIDTSGVLTLHYGDKTVLCEGAKDHDSSEPSVIACRDGRLEIEEPLSRVTGFRICRTNGETEIFQAAPADRMRTEFENILHLLECRDKEGLALLTGYSLEAARIMELARKQAGIRFACDQ